MFRRFLHPKICLYQLTFLCCWNYKESVQPLLLGHYFHSLLPAKWTRKTLFLAELHQNQVNSVAAVHTKPLLGSFCSLLIKCFEETFCRKDVKLYHALRWLIMKPYGKSNDKARKTTQALWYMVL